MDIVLKIKEIIKKEFDKDVKAIYRFDDNYYVVVDDFLNSMLYLINMELETCEGFVFIDSDLGNKIIDPDNEIY